ncbi:hypothetical protein SynROS8604_02999 [Synechococcus sp. ROS8604]|nr:hypothetical protein SynROS8604_02999 [Synechococcus sp. ROS8604]
MLIPAEKAPRLRSIPNVHIKPDLYPSQTIGQREAHPLSTSFPQAYTAPLQFMPDKRLRKRD